MARGVLIGGIYGRPLALGNFMHFVVATIVLLKVLNLQSPLPVLIGTGAYAVLGSWFGMVLFTHPSNRTSATDPG